MASDRNQLGFNPYVNVLRMLDRHQALLEGDNTKTMVGPFEADEANVHTILSCSGMFIPFELVDFFWGKDLTVRDAYLVVYPLLEDNDMLKVDHPLLELLQVASIQPTTGKPHPLTL
jgi:hypothetical protein